MVRSPSRGLALGGFMGVGKTTVGAGLARRIGMPFADTDEILAARFGPVADQILRDGEAAFREREVRLIAELCDGTPRVVATGGGAWERRENRDRLRSCCWLVVLHASLDEIRRRVGEGVGRPLLAEAVALRERRASAYADADLCLDTEGLSPGEVEARIARWLEAR